MKSSIRTRFTIGMIFLFIIILILSVFSGYYLNKMSNKTGAILKENYISVVFAREMSVTLLDQDRKELTNKDLEELKKMMVRVKTMEDQVAVLISKLEK